MKIFWTFLIVIFINSTLLPQEINYILTIENPHRNYFNVEINYQVNDESYVDFVMPAWTPGSYYIEDWSKNVIGVEAKNSLDSVLNCQKIDKQTWRVEVSQSRVIKLKYKIYAYSLNNPYYAHIDADFAYFNGALIFMYIEGKKDLPCNLEFVYPEDWEIHTSLQNQLGEDKYQAVNYDEFIDCPAFLGNLHKFSFEVQGKEHFVVFNSWYEMDEDQIMEDLSNMVDWFYTLFGELPYDHYTFFLRVSESGGGGIEHLYSNISAVKPQSLSGDLEDEAYYSKLLMLECHEYFHLFNVKRIRPTDLGPFDYTNEVYTKLLWVSEGFTTYYTDRPLLKAGVIDEDKLFKSWAKRINSLTNNSALYLKPISQYSFDAWLNSKIPDYSFRTYYTKGAMLGLLIDLEMRLQTNHKKTMDGFFRFLYDNVYKQGNTFDLNSFLQYLNKYSLLDFSDFFNRYVTGIEQMPIQEYLEKVGLKLKVEKELPFIGIKLNPKVNNTAIVYYVYPESPADNIKISRGDHVISIDREKVTKENWNEVLQKIDLQEDVELQWIHNNQLKTANIKLEKQQTLEYSVHKNPEITDKQQRFLKTWLLP